MRNERYYQIPLCKKDCDSWFDDCKNDFTCRDNWNKGFVWKNSTVTGTRKLLILLFRIKYVFEKKTQFNLRL